MGVRTRTVHDAADGHRRAGPVLTFLAIVAVAAATSVLSLMGSWRGAAAPPAPSPSSATVSTTAGAGPSPTSSGAIAPPPQPLPGQ